MKRGITIPRPWLENDAQRAIDAMGLSVEPG
jgi:hypothetical protein